MLLGWLVLSARRGQGVNEDNEGEKRVCTCLSAMCTNVCVRPVIYLCVSSCICVWAGAFIAEGYSPCQTLQGWERGDYGVTGGLTMSLTRSFSPLTVSTVNSGIMVMYQGMDEMAGTHWRPYARMDTHVRKRKQSHTHSVNHAHTQSASTSNNHHAKKTRLKSRKLWKKLLSGPWVKIIMSNYTTQMWRSNGLMSIKRNSWCQGSVIIAIWQLRPQSRGILFRFDQGGNWVYVRCVAW